jgi:hypothetical protein
MLIREGLADARLEGTTAAGRYGATTAMQVVRPAAALRSCAPPNGEQVDRLIFGEIFDALEDQGEILFGQARRDGYVGYADAEAFSPQIVLATHWVRAPRSAVFVESSIKSQVLGLVSLNALLAIDLEENGLSRDPRLGWVASVHLLPIGETLSDPAGVAETFLGAPYWWGGRESLGLDCSGLVQQSLYACGLACPRDADQQAALGDAVDLGDLARGDLVFWRGHVGMMLDQARLIHANAFHMAVVAEPLAEAVARIEARGGGAPTAARRIRRYLAKI